MLFVIFSRCHGWLVRWNYGPKAAGANGIVELRSRSPPTSPSVHLRVRQQQSENEMTRNEWQSKRLHEKLSWSRALGLRLDL